MIVFLILISIIYEPIIAIMAFKIRLKTFRLHKPKNDNKYYLQIRLFFTWYYIYKSIDSYNLAIYPDRFCINYNNYIIVSKKNNILNDKYEIIKSFSNETEPEDNINL